MKLKYIYTVILLILVSIKVNANLNYHTIVIKLDEFMVKKAIIDIAKLNKPMQLKAPSHKISVKKQSKLKLRAGSDEVGDDQSNISGGGEDYTKGMDIINGGGEDYTGGMDIINGGGEDYTGGMDIVSGGGEDYTKGMDVYAYDQNGNLVKINYYFIDGKLIVEFYDNSSDNSNVTIVVTDRKSGKSIKVRNRG